MLYSILAIESFGKCYSRQGKSGVSPDHSLSIHTESFEKLNEVFYRLQGFGKFKETCMWIENRTREYGEKF